MKNKPIIKALIFDLGGVVAHGGFLNFIRHYCLKCLTPAGKKKIAQLERDVNLGKISEREFYKQIQKVFAVQMTPKQMHEYIVKNMQADKALIKHISKLKKIKTALFSNSIGSMAAEVLRRQHIPSRKLFNRVFYSTDLHLVKPDKEAYLYVLKKLKVKPSEALMVDDRLENIKKARKIGMQGIVYKNARQFKKDLQKFDLGQAN